MSNNAVVVKDSCILFDLMDVGLLEEFLQLGFSVHTTQLVIAEITDEEQLATVTQYINNGSLKVDLSDVYDDIAAIYDDTTGLSFTDCSVIELALRLNGNVLSADRKLRNEASRRTMPVKGLLWVIEQMLQKEIINTTRAVAALERYGAINRRAPQKEIEKHLKRLKGLE